MTYSGIRLIGPRELFLLLEAAIDGIDGEECESGYLRYWDEATIKKARRLIDDVRAGRAILPEASDE